jgi:hypothetical protein
MPGVKVNAGTGVRPPSPRLQGLHAQAARSIRERQAPNQLDNDNDSK